MSISVMPDVVLLIIFDQLPLAELLRKLRLVCRQWNTIIPAACNRRNSLALQPAEPHRRQLVLNSPEHSIDLQLFQHLVNEDNTPFVTGNVYIRPIDIIYYSQISPRFSARISELFPQIASLYLFNEEGQQTFTTNMVNLAVFTNLLHTWRPPLKRLHIVFSTGDCGAKSGMMAQMARTWSIQSVWDPLTEFIRHSTSLRRLKLHIMEELDILPWGLFPLKKYDYFSFKSGTSRRERVNVPTTLLRRYRHEINGYPQKVAFDNVVTLFELFNCDLELAQSITHLRVCEGYDEIEDVHKYWSDALSSLTSLQSLVIEPNCANLSLLSLTRSLHKSSQLTHLTLAFDETNAPPEAIPVEELPRLPSVKVLTLDISLRSHSRLEELQLPFIFPSVQVIHFRNNCLSCTECEFEWTHENPIEFGAHYVQCMRLTRRMLIVFRQLRIVCTQERTDWFNWSKEIIEIKAEDL